MKRHVNPASAAALENPFPGLRPFRQDEEHLFFGRESQVDRMVDKLAATRFLAVVGTSGSGKSSLVNCGLKPALHRGLMAGAGTSWRMVQFRPAGSPLRSMARAFASEAAFFGNYQPDGLSLFEIVEATLKMSSLGLADLYEYAHFDQGVNLLVVVDQFEELFRYGKAGTGSRDSYGVSGDAIALVNLLLEAHAHPEFPIFIVLTMRSDFLGECSQFEGLPEVINESQYLVPRLTREEIREAIAGPIGVAGGELSPVLLTRLVNDVGDNPDQLSILQHAINRTWGWWQKEGGGEGALSLEHYETVGTMTRALDRHAEEAFAELGTGRQQKICEKIFKALTDKGTDARGIRRPMPLKTLCDVAGASHDEVLPVLEVFRIPTRSFLMPPIAEPAEPETVIDISHESLMRVWERLKLWADEEAQSANTYRRLAETAGLHALGKAALWRDPDLETALEWQWKEMPNAAWAHLYRSGFESALSFLAASKRVRDEEMAEAEFARRWRRVTPFIAAFVFAIFLYISPKLSESLAPKVRPLVERFFKRPVVEQGISALDSVASVHDLKRKHFAEALVNGFGYNVSAVMCILGYAALSFAGKRTYRYFAFPGIAERANAQRPAVEKIQVPDVFPAGTGRKESASSAAVEGDFILANFWLRLFAAVIDLLVFLMLVSFSFILFAIVLAALGLKPGDLNDAVVGFIFVFSLPILDYLYQSLMTVSRWGGTLGELACGIAVTDRSGKRPSFGRISGRYAAKALSWLTLGAGFLVQLFTARKQALHDLIAGTIVIRQRRARPSHEIV
jgi:uncharacterized RDD family membrane protein YckC